MKVLKKIDHAFFGLEGEEVVETDSTHEEIKSDFWGTVLFYGTFIFGTVATLLLMGVVG